jgi:hypothetical protein
MNNHGRYYLKLKRVNARKAKKKNNGKKKELVNTYNTRLWEG